MKAQGLDGLHTHSAARSDAPGRLRWWAAPLLAASLGACSSASSAPNAVATPGDAGSGADAASALVADAGAVAPEDSSAGSADASACQADPDIVAYAPNLAKTGASGLIQFVLTSADPAPPSKGNNIWTLKLLDSSGQPITDATMSPTGGGIKTWMPFMRHGLSILPSEKSNGDGTYTIGSLNLTMAGVWQVTFTAKTGSISDSAVFTFCVED